MSNARNQSIRSPSLWTLIIQDYGRTEVLPKEMRYNVELLSRSDRDQSISRAAPAASTPLARWAVNCTPGNACFVNSWKRRDRGARAWPRLLA